MPGAASPACLGEWAWGFVFCCHSEPFMSQDLQCPFPSRADPHAEPGHCLHHTNLPKSFTLATEPCGTEQQPGWHPGECQGHWAELAPWLRAGSGCAVLHGLVKSSSQWLHPCRRWASISAEPASHSPDPLCSLRRLHAPRPCILGCHREGESAKSQEIFHQAWEAAAHTVHRHILALFLPAASWSSQILRQRTCRNKRYFSLSQVPLETVQDAASFCSPISTCN